MRPDADIGVVGGGPAGLAAAIEAAGRGFDVVLFEPRVGPIDKACGEGLMPGALDALDALGAARPEGIEFVGVSYRDAQDAELVAHGSFPRGSGLGVRRTTLHATLEDRLHDLDVTRAAERVRHVELRDDGVVLDTGHRVGWLIGADGLHSTVRGELGLDGGTPRSERFGVRRHYAVAPWTDRVEVYWSARGEAYVTPVEDELVGVAFLSDPPGRFDDLLARFPVLAERLEGAEVASRDRGAGAFGRTASSPQKGRALLVGDAAGYVDALTGEGIALAITSAREAVDAIARGRPESYPARYRRTTRRWAWTTRGLLAMTRPRRVHRPLIRMLRAFPFLFDRALGLLS